MVCGPSSGCTPARGGVRVPGFWCYPHAEGHAEQGASLTYQRQDDAWRQPNACVDEGEVQLGDRQGDSRGARLQRGILLACGWGRRCARGGGVRASAANGHIPLELNGCFRNVRARKQYISG